ncbi:type 1 glutamine amidotransferase family protein [Pararhizobium qamdonense]|uniref:transporter n=1 Tax=Pararhizobium qamdonense TaxID=3031126 RepID=UPI0023E0FBB6|nr:transporter [Pararhizobium qamdonense]
MDRSQPIRFLVILSTDEGGEISSGEVRLGRIAPAYYLFKDEGAEVVLATLTGGYPKLPDFGQLDQQDPSIRRFLDDREARDDLADTLGVHQIVTDDFDAALCLGFSGPLWEEGNQGTALVLASLLEGGRPVAIIPGNAVPVSPRGAANGLLMIGDANDAPVMAAHALLKIVFERRKLAI